MAEFLPLPDRKYMVDIWLNTEFEGGRHCISLGLIAEIEDTLLTMPEGGDSVMEPGK